MFRISKNLPFAAAGRGRRKRGDFTGRADQSIGPHGLFGRGGRNCLDLRPYSNAGSSIAAVAVILIALIPVALIAATPCITPILICVLASELVIPLGVLIP